MSENIVVLERPLTGHVTYPYNGKDTPGQVHTKGDQYWSVRSNRPLEKGQQVILTHRVSQNCLWVQQ